MTQSLPGTSGGPGNAQTSIIAIKPVATVEIAWRLGGARGHQLVISNVIMMRRGCLINWMESTGINWARARRSIANMLRMACFL